MKSYCYARETADMHFMYAMAMEILGKRVACTQNIIHNAETHPTNYSPDFASD
jgi:hypothetical protein